MAMDKYDFIRTSPLFYQCGEELIEYFIRDLREERHEKGSFPYTCESTLDRFFIISSGRLKMFQTNDETGREYTIYMLVRGDCFDILTLLDGEKHEIFTEAIDDLVVFSTDISKVRKILEKWPEFNRNFFPYLGHRMRLLEVSAVDNAITDTATRLAKLIFENVDNSEKVKPHLINNLSHDELAKLIGTTGAVVNRHLQLLKKEGIISIERKMLHIKNLELLAKKYFKRK
jgi:CRP/FNR family transcriptional regulator